MADLTERIMQIRNSQLPEIRKKELERRLIREGPILDIDRVLREALASPDTPIKSVYPEKEPQAEEVRGEQELEDNTPSETMSAIVELNALERKRVIGSVVRDTWITRIKRDGVTPEVLAQLKSFRRREQEMIHKEWEQREAERRQKVITLHPEPRHAQPAPDAEIRCPKCGSNQITAQKKGYGLGNAAIGGVLLGPVGLLGGFVGSKKILITCLRCGHSWTPGGK